MFSPRFWGCARQFLRVGQLLGCHLFEYDVTGRTLRVLSLRAIWRHEGPHWVQRLWQMVLFYALGVYILLDCSYLTWILHSTPYVSIPTTPSDYIKTEMHTVTRWGAWVGGTILWFHRNTIV